MYVNEHIRFKPKMKFSEGNKISIQNNFFKNDLLRQETNQRNTLKNTINLILHIKTYVNIETCVLFWKILLNICL